MVWKGTTSRPSWKGVLSLLSTLVLVDWEAITSKELVSIGKKSLVIPPLTRHCCSQFWLVLCHGHAAWFLLFMASFKTVEEIHKQIVHLRCLFCYSSFRRFGTGERNKCKACDSNKHWITKRKQCKWAATCIFLGIFRPNQDVNIEKVKGEGKSKLSAYTQNNAHQTAKSTWSQKSCDPLKGGTEGHGKANCLWQKVHQLWLLTTKTGFPSRRPADQNIKISR